MWFKVALYGCGLKTINSCSSKEVYSKVAVPHLFT